MLSLEKLSFSNIGRFVEEQSIDFNRLDSLIQLDALNKNTGGSSGSGKTTCFHALEYLFGLNDIPNTVLQSRLTKDGICVTGEFKWDGKPLIIQRSKSKGLEIQDQDELTKGNNKLAEEKLDKIIGIPRKLFRPMLHKRQGEGGFFLDFAPKEINDFLIDCLGLSSLRDKAAKLDKKVKDISESKASLLSAVSSERSALVATQEAILSLGLAPIQDMHQAVVDKLLEKATASESVLRQTEARHRQETERLDQSKPKIYNAQFDTTQLLFLEGRLREKQIQGEKLALAEKDRQAAVSAKIVALQMKERDRQAQVKKQIEVLNLQERDRRAIASQALSEVKMNKMVAESQISNGQGATEMAKEVAAQIKKLRDSICPTCEQSWVTQSAKAKESALLAQLVDLKQAIVLGQTAQADLPLLSAQMVTLSQEVLPRTPEGLPALLELSKPQEPQGIKELEAEQKPRNPEGLIEVQAAIFEISTSIATEKESEKQFRFKLSQENKLLLDIFAKNQTDCRIRQAQEIDTDRGQYDIDRRAYDAAAAKLRAYEDSKRRYDFSLAHLKKQEIDYGKKVEDLESKLFKIDQEALVAEEVRRAIKNYTSCSFDEALESIGDMATQIVRSSPNMANATIQLEGQRETKDGKVKEEVNAVISMDGEIGIPIKSLSGGERAAVDMAVDLSVLRFIEERNAIGCDTFILDEPFQGLSAIEIEPILEMLKNSNTEKRLVIVSHDPVVKEMVQDRIVVVREGLVSHLEISK